MVFGIPGLAVHMFGVLGWDGWGIQGYGMVIRSNTNLAVYIVIKECGLVVLAMSDHSFVSL